MTAARVLGSVGGALPTSETRSAKLSRGAARLSIITITAVLGVAVVVGAAAAVIGGPLGEVGSGASGLWGVPQLTLVGVAVFVALPGAVITLLAPVPHRFLRSALLLVGPVAIAAAFFVVPHMLDPCAGGRWTLGSHAGDVPLCEAWGGGINIAERFHLVLHGIVGSVVALPILLALRPMTDPLGGSPASGRSVHGVGDKSLIGD